MPKVYKVVDKYRDTSAIIPGEFQLRYFIGRTTRPNIGKIFAFDTIENADDFMGCSNAYSVFECDCENPSVAKRIIPTRQGLCYDKIGISLFWSEYEKGIYKGYRPLKGTILCDSITPIRRIV